VSKSSTTSTSFEDVESALRGELAARVADLSEGPAPLARIDAAARRQQIRRTAVGGAGLVVALALVAATMPTVLADRSGIVPTAAGSESKGESPLLSMAPRGNLVGQVSFMQAVENRLSGYKILYANDDGQHTVVIAAEYGPMTSNPANANNSELNQFEDLVGGHGATAAQLSTLSAVPNVGTTAPVKTYTFIDTGLTGDASMPYVVLGPANLTEAELSTGVKLTVHGGKLVPERTGTKTVAARDGVAAGEIPNASSATKQAQLDRFLTVRATIGNATVDANPDARQIPAAAADNPGGPAYDSIREAVVAKGAVNGLNLLPSGPGGDAVADNVAQVLYDLVNLAGVSTGAVTVHVDWVGRETSAWDSALVDFSAPGLPAIQAFVRGLAPGQSDSESPGLARSYVRPAVALTPGRIPTTAAAFGGTSEFTTIESLQAEGW